MKRIVKLIIILSVFTQVCNAQKIETVEEFKALYDSIAPRLKLAEKEANSCIDRPFSEFVKLMDKYGVKIIRILMKFDSSQLYPKDVFGLDIKFTTDETFWFAMEYGLQEPIAVIYFKENKPYEKALSLSRKYKSCFTEEIEEFYSDASIKSIEFAFLGSMYGRDYRSHGEK
jgi:hypothetical protein